MALEDIANDYTEVDPATFINTDTTDTRADFVNMQLDIEAYFYKDFTASHFGNFTHFIVTEITGTPGGSVSVAGYAVTTTLDDLSRITDGFMIYWRASSAPLADLRLEDASDSSIDTFSGAAATIYYLKCIRTGTAWSVEIYTGGKEDTLVDTIATTGTSTAFRYTLVAQSDNEAGGDRSITGYWKDLDLQEAVGANAPTGTIFGPLFGPLGGPA